MAGKAQRSIDHYQVLNVAPDAPLEGIRAAYRTAVLQLHPDKAGADYGQKEWQRNEEFIRVQQAWEVMHFSWMTLWTEIWIEWPCRATLSCADPFHCGFRS